MEQAPVLGWGFHMRTHVVTILLGALDALMAYNSITTTIESGPTMHILFGFEVRSMVSPRRPILVAKEGLTTLCVVSVACALVRAHIV